MAPKGVGHRLQVWDVHLADPRDDVVAAEARLLGTIGDIMGYDFIDIHGRSSSKAMQGRVIGLTIRDLVRIPDVVAIASENTKAAAILGALRTGVVNTLVTSSTNARTVLRLDDAMRELTRKR